MNAEQLAEIMARYEHGEGLLDDVPALLAEVERLRAALAEIGTECDNYRRGRCADRGHTRESWCRGCTAAAALVLQP